MQLVIKIYVNFKMEMIKHCNVNNKLIVSIGKFGSVTLVTIVMY